MDRLVKNRRSKIEDQNLEEGRKSKVESLVIASGAKQSRCEKPREHSDFQKEKPLEVALHRQEIASPQARNDTLKLTAFLIVLFSIFTLSFGQTTELERQVFDISRELRCPVCTSEAVADSNGDVSVEMRSIIQEQLEEGKSREEILAYFQASYGDWILLDPPKSGLHLVVWLLPMIAGALGVATLLYFFRRWTQRSAAPIEASEDELRRVREALE